MPSQTFSRYKELPPIKSASHNRDNLNSPNEQIPSARKPGHHHGQDSLVEEKTNQWNMSSSRTMSKNRILNNEVLDQHQVCI